MKIILPALRGHKAWKANKALLYFYSPYLLLHLAYTLNKQVG